MTTSTGLNWSYDMGGSYQTDNISITDSTYTFPTTPYTTVTTGSPGLMWHATDTILGANTNPGVLQVSGDANFEGDVKIKGKSLVESLEKIEEKLAILHPNEELEEKWEKLRSLRKMYMELEQEIIEKEKVWSILKK